MRDPFPFPTPFDLPVTPYTRINARAIEPGVWRLTFDNVVIGLLVTNEGGENWLRNLEAQTRQISEAE